MNRLSWDTTAPRRPRRAQERKPDEREFADESELLRPAWDELRRVHRL
jgi:hypothetical protein